MTPLYGFQREGADLVWKKFKGRAALCDEMGLGKSIQALTVAVENTTGPTLVICPAYLKLNWEQEALIHFGMRPQILWGESPIVPDRDTIRRRLVLINYDILSDWADFLEWLDPELVIVDEFQYIKEPGTKRCKATKTICRRAKYVIGLSGTPIENRPIEFFPMLQILRPGMFKSRHAYGMDYCQGKRTRWGWDYRGAGNLGILHNKLLQSCMIRRRKADVLKELPNKIRAVVPIGMNFKQSELYQHAEDNFLDWVSTYQGSTAAQSAAKAETITQMNALKKLAGQFKFAAAVEWITNFLEDTDSKLVVFGHHTQLLEAVYTHFKKQAVLVTGKVPSKERHARKERFQKDKSIRLLVGNMRAAGMGLTLTAADSMLFIELGWTPGGHAQCEDRIHRIGQKMAARIYYMIMRGTIEEMIVELLHEKQKNLDTAIDGRPDAVSFDVWKKLIQHYKKKAAARGKSR